MTSWYVFTGSGKRPQVPPALPAPPPWRQLPLGSDYLGPRYRVPQELLPAINAALVLRRPLLLTGPAGVGKSSVADSIAFELGLGEVLRWDISSSSAVSDGIYRYDALDRLRYTQQSLDPAIERFIKLGPLGTALASTDLRVVLIDELDKADVDFAGDLLNILERGEYEIPELARHEIELVDVPLHDGGQALIRKGLIQASKFPVVVITSNGERDFSPALLRRCIPYQFPYPSLKELCDIVEAHLGPIAVQQLDSVIADFAQRMDPSAGNEALAVDQLLNSVFLLAGRPTMTDSERSKMLDLLQRELRAGS